VTEPHAIVLQRINKAAEEVERLVAARGRVGLGEVDTIAQRYNVLTTRVLDRLRLSHHVDYEGGEVRKWRSP
jgi:hypothetical protein